jgi:bcr-type benzoyl-CoA reductase subunit C
MTALEELVELAEVPYNRTVKDWKEKGGKVVGFICSYIPEEILHAGGILPYRLSPTGCTETTEADAYMSHFNCTFARSCLQFALTGEYEYLDGIVLMNSCDHLRRLYDNWKHAVGSPYMHYLSVPHRLGEGPEGWYRDELTIFKESVEEAFGVEITKESLLNSIDVHNRIRGLLKEIHELMQREKPPLMGSEMLKIIVAGFRSPKEEYAQLLEKLLSELTKEEGTTDYPARLMLMGGACDNPDFVQVIEDAGGLVVADTLCFGTRYFWNMVEVDGDPISALAKFYLNNPSCARMAGDQTERWNYAKQMIQDFKVDGVVIQRLKWCDLWGGEAFFVGEMIKELDLPFILLEREFWVSGEEQLKTRIQAMVELIEGKRR